MSERYIWEDEFDDLSARANKAIADYVLKQYKSLGYYQTNKEHLKKCDEAVIELKTATDGSYGCDTGCEYFRIESVISCPHGETDNYEHGEFGMMWYDVDGLEEALKEK